jgi:repressor LexA
LSRRRRQILAFIRTFSVSHPYPPSLQEIANHFGVNRPTAFYHVQILKQHGFLQNTSGRMRTLVVVDR